MSRRSLLIIIFAHVAFFSFFSIKHVKAKRTALRPVVVETVVFAPPPPPKPVVVKPKPKPVVKAKPKPKPKPVVKAKAKPAPKPVVKAKPKPSRKPVATKPTVVRDLASELSYRQELGGRIRLLLRLPEEGMVRVALTLKRTGEIAKIEILDFQGEVNREYVGAELKRFTFDPFGKAFAKDEEHTFELVLTSA